MILLVEDQAVARHAFAQLLAVRGYEVMEAADGQEALNLLERHQFDLVVTDLALPKVTGFGLVIQMHAKWPEIPVILVTAYLSPDAAKTILQDNVTFLPKPLDPGKLMATVERFTSHPR